MRLALSVVGLAGLLACSVYTEDLLVEDDGGGASSSSAGGTGGASSSSGGANSSSASGGSGGGGLKGNGENCGQPAQCTSSQCVDGVCCASACNSTCQRCDLMGSAGTCSAVAEGQDPDNECAADVCNGAGACRCSDGNQNGSETDTDCGGPDCATCMDGASCTMASDCLSGVCNVTCQPPSCSDMVKNNVETDVDCGGGCPLGCADGAGCAIAGDCQSGACDGTMCLAPICGDSATNGSEECDDGNTDDFDGCSSGCLNPVAHLLISEFAVQPNGAEFIEIYNPSNQTVALNTVYLADFTDYYTVTGGSASPNSADFAIKFPAGATIAANGFVVISLESATTFTATYGVAPDYDIDAADAGAPVMLGEIGSTAGLTNNDEMIVLFSWDGVAATVTDLDYVVYGNTSDAMNKTGVAGYLPDTPPGNQMTASSPGAGSSSHRCDTGEASETKTGGNGISGHDESSEDGGAAFKTLATPTPGAAPAAGFCP